MKTFTEIGLQKQLQRFADSLSHAAYQNSGETKRIDFMKLTAEGDTVRVYIYFDDSVAGQIGNVELIDHDGDIVARAEREFIKPASKGLYVAFKYRLIEMEVEGLGI
ncbi:hypothetical protein WJ0W_007067 [Paenibacillus melissococcoides]|uniref:Uncharacterized protein n=1 Tax=Paenibacillus melissococcoides TaxID=2912268 RepID=A0ABN8U538_9BACL|nr:MULTISPECIES: hypothetical protein [Paenibacillus]MEB9894797.1 hypothetical protein [Bacillus cereus]CAH8244434.1 hypothetical protein WJ0W_001669 [Paenibacillus melissococcoides]CAH8244439.1 hypothetical protein WJ0W_001674 [Paenibacillus melissococcoides]CAH8247741.1 hypothetical protein WJ0W_004998 [Paenibacillus melissococcoides]CAH8248839.1 hypothetical protein WJ0W_006023 [Paenibacillus melissococcoides]